MNKLFGKRETPFLILDIGTKAIKSLIVKKENNKLSILGSGLIYFNGFSLINDFQIQNLSKAILKSVQEASNNFLLFPAKNRKDLPLLLTLSPDILKLRVITESFEREKESRISKSEADNILKDILFKAKKKIANDFTKESGILFNDIHWVNFKVIGKKINGYSVSKVQGCNGKSLEIKVLGAFIAKRYFNIIENICLNLGFRQPRIISLGRGLIASLGQTNKSGIFIDVGGSVSQALLLKDGIIDKVYDFKAGGDRFTQALSEVLAIDEDSARMLKHKYAVNDLSEKVRIRVKNILSSEKDFWEKTVDVRGAVYVFGGASLLPEIKEPFKAAVVYPKHLKNIKSNLNSPQFVPSLLISYYAGENL